MKNNLSGLSPQEVWKHFYALTQIPRPSKHEDEVAKYVYDFGLGLGLVTERDEVGNVIIRKPATPGKESCKTVALQAHLDMVPQKNDGVAHDFTKDAIDAYVDGEWVTARDTTLGADNGIGVAAAMAVLESKSIAHGPIEALFTIDEETGMTGAFGLKAGFVKADILLNLDSEDEGELYVGCAGGIDVEGCIHYEEEKAPEGDVFMEVIVKGLKGGHSGLDIDRGRANANKLLFRFLKHAIGVHEVRLACIDGGNMRNAIPREAKAVISLPAEGVCDLKQDMEEFLSIFRKEYQYTEPNIAMLCEKSDWQAGVLPEVVQDDVVNAVTACSNGVFRMDFGMPGVVETSSSMGIVKSNGSEVSIKILVRSFAESNKEELCSSLESVLSLAGARVTFSGDYPGWKPDPNSTILDTMKKVYEKKWGKTPAVKAIHAGLECGIIGSVYPQMEMISFGPTIRFPHSPDEKIDIATVDMFWQYLCEVLETVE